MFIFLVCSEVNKFKEESFKDRNKQDREIANAKDEVQVHLLLMEILH